MKIQESTNSKMSHPEDVYKMLQQKETESKKHNVYYMGKFIKEIEFDTMETCFLSQSYRYYNKGFLIGVMPFDYSFFASNGEIIRFDEPDEDYFYNSLTTEQKEFHDVLKEELLKIPFNVHLYKNK